MTASRSTSAGKSSRVATAGEVATGGGAGGALIYVINNYVTDPKLQGLLVYFAPTVSIFITGVFSLFVRKFEEWYEHSEPERQRKALLKRTKASLTEAKRDYEAIEKDPKATATHKKSAKDPFRILS